ncbi:hypothetical protein FRB95_000754 [Tulasnella sp. JGI-2019a]|nr:hypothetical protein FRB95_000754 [Tulasnella sp. JGI-2019a]
MFHIADASVVSQICMQRTAFPKPEAMYSSLELYGPNVVAREGATWAQHRKITSPAFSEPMIHLAWEQTSRVVHDMFDDWSNQGDVVELHEIEEPMKQLAMLILMGAAFGHIEDWTPEVLHPLGHSMSLRDSLQVLLKSFHIYSILPKWIWGSSQTRTAMRVGGIGGLGGLGETVQETGTAYVELGRYLREMVHDREITGGDIETKRVKRDVFSSLVAAMSIEDESARITLDDVFGNMFVFLLAGHETTAHSLTFALGLLALEQEEQEKLHAHIKEVLGDREPTFEDHGRLTRVLAVFYETLRLFPSGTFIPKEAAEDAHFMVNSALSEEEVADPLLMGEKNCQKSLFIPKGSTVWINIAGLHYNPRYWKDPYAFNPNRFLESDWPKEAFMSFSAGPRGCLGRKFAEVEAVLALTLVIRRYKVTVDTKRFRELAGESILDRRNRLMNADMKITLTPQGVPLVMTRR